MAPSSSRLEVDETDDLLKLEDNRTLKKQTEVDGATKTHRHKIYWNLVVTFSIYHFGAVVGVYLLPTAMWQTLLFSLVMFVLANLGTTAAAHRLGSHRSFKVKTPLKIFLCWIQTISNQYSIIDWAKDHRLHHKFSETEADPHNATRGFVFSHIGWVVTKKLPIVIEEGKKIDVSDLRNDPIYAFQKRHYTKLARLFSVILPTLIPPMWWGETWANAFFIAVCLRYVAAMHSIFSVNSFAHMYGSREYDTRINPAQNFWVSVFMLGEGWHNYHHTFPHDYSANEHPWTINLTTMFIDFMAYIGQAYDCKRVSQSAIDRRKERTGGNPH